jgi:hypothetical protein
MWEIFVVFSENLKFTIRNYKNRTRIEYKTRPVVPGGAGGAMAPPDFGRSVNRIFRPSDGPENEQ